MSRTYLPPMAMKIPARARSKVLLREDLTEYHSKLAPGTTWVVHSVDSKSRDLWIHCPDGEILMLSREQYTVSASN